MPGDLARAFFHVHDAREITELYEMQIQCAVAFS